jgi:hypothetical protein
MTGIVWNLAFVGPAGNNYSVKFKSDYAIGFLFETQPMAQRNRGPKRAPVVLNPFPRYG